MIQSFVDRFMAARPELEKRFAEKHVDDYADIVRMVVETVTSPDEYDDDSIDPDRIHSINDGEYQGTLVFVIGAKGYQPNDYWYVKVYYGSCSGCDTLQVIRSYSDDKPDTAAVDGYMRLALHIVQGLKKMGDA